MFSQSLNDQELEGMVSRRLAWERFPVDCDHVQRGGYPLNFQASVLAMRKLLCHSELLSLAPRLRL